ncbi:MAG: iron ABC transporter permease, partial [Gammaproteobacteria bacterium]|nr:iron ABC transporter permease [Gammaproteobacteria bacterium]
MLITLLISPLLGIHTIALSDILSENAGTPQYRIFWSLRVPRVITSFVTGASLSISGMTFQAVYRNALATPFTLGV